MSNLKHRKMKSIKMKSLVNIFPAILISSLLIITACNNKKVDTDHDTDPNSASQEKVDPPSIDLHTAAVLGNLEAVQQHIKAGSDLDVKDPNVGSSPLITATVFGKTEVARALIDGGAYVNFQNNEGSTPLHTAAFLCRTEIVDMLLAKGADKNLKNIYGQTPHESVSKPFENVKFAYDEFSKALGPMGLKLDYDYIAETRPLIAEKLQ
jgi:ankyrin repeat protein